MQGLLCSLSPTLKANAGQHSVHAPVGAHYEINQRWNKKIYLELSKQFTDQEIVEGYVFPADLDELEKETIEAEFRALRLKALKESTEEQRLLSALMRMKLLIQDYLGRSDFEKEFSFAQQLEQYIKLIGRSQKDFAAEIDLHPTKLSRLLNGRDNPNNELVYRLEKHCGNVIPAIYWWKLYAKQIGGRNKNG